MDGIVQYPDLLKRGAAFATANHLDDVPRSLSVHLSMVDFCLGTAERPPLSFSEAVVALSSTATEPDEEISEITGFTWDERIRAMAGSVLAQDILTTLTADDDDVMDIAIIPSVDMTAVIDGLNKSLESGEYSAEEIVYGTDDFRAIPVYTTGIYLDCFEHYVDVDISNRPDGWEAEVRWVTTNALDNVFSE